MHIAMLFCFSEALFGWFTHWRIGYLVGVRTAELVARLACAPQSWTRAGHLFREKYSENTRELRLLICWLEKRAPVVVFFIETDPARHIVLCLG